VNAEDRRFMRLALRQARKGRTSPNPHVGAVVVRDGERLAVGHHVRAGEAHAEVMALKAAGQGASGATLYVTLEPCNHHGRTPPCTEAVIAAGIARVVVGCEDPSPHTEGSAARLRAAGIEVLVGVEREAAQEVIADFAKHHVSGLPFVHVKSAVTLDGRVATRSGDTRWITGETSRRAVHRMRARADAILVASGTALADDPALNVRSVRGLSPRRVLLDSALRVPPTAQLFARDGTPAPRVYHAQDAPAASRRALEAVGAECVSVPRDAGRLSLSAVLEDLGRRETMRLMVEAGPALLGSLLDADLVDELSVFVAPLLIGDEGALPMARGRALERLADAVRLEPLRIRRYGDDVCFEGRPTRPRT